MPSRRCHGCLSPVPALPGSLSPWNPGPEPQPCSCGPGEAKPLPQQGWGRAGQYLVLTVAVTRIVPVEVQQVHKTWRTPPQEVHELPSPLQERDIACVWTLPMESWTTAPLTHPPWQAQGQPFPGHPHSQGMCTGRREWLPCSWDLAEVRSHAWC